VLCEQSSKSLFFINLQTDQHLVKTHKSHDLTWSSASHLQRKQRLCELEQQTMVERRLQEGLVLHLWRKVSVNWRQV
jgi:hypothetical protein